MPNPTLCCPYAIRARLGLLLSKQEVNLREIELKRKPEAMLQLSLKGTVPVLVLSDGKVIDESLNIIWALKINDPQQLLINDSPEKSQVAMTLIQYNDNHFKP